MSEIPSLLRIGELAEQTAKTVRALHLYEERGLIEPAERSPGGFRLYDAANVARIGYIDRLQKLGLSLTAISALIGRWAGEARPADAMVQLRDAYQARLAELRETIADLQRIEGELTGALGFLDGCSGCERAQAPPVACRSCRRVEEQVEAPLISGLTGA